MADLSETVEMAALDKEMAEEKVGFHLSLYPFCTFHLDIKCIHLKCIMLWYQYMISCSYFSSLQLAVSFHTLGIML